ncbi:sensor histidine kinase [Asticcacaulis machinosus]|uniref:histidine kinase n=1 Tax=Asticcacaulis machinosus TaxID=2984211 RepID=A0ABT5HIT4_9CAUL|nr:HAMP domain-containing sensor histidine kinase [Asticcacaulis machinosus]MDC7676144.1 HAMP domain-containing sensor histidine kinase [Asticcacaulis machinosus]
MVFDSRIFRICLTILFGAASVLVYDSLTRQLWANAVIGLACSLGLMAAIAAIRLPQDLRTPPDPVMPDMEAERLQALLDQVQVPIVSQAAGRPLKAENRAARSLFMTDGLIAEDINLHAVGSGAGAGNASVVSIFSRHYTLSVSELHKEPHRVRVAALIDVEAEVHKAEAFALRQTLQVLSHEIMNSLTPVSSLAEIADMYLADPAGADVPPAREALETLKRRAVNLARFIEAYRSVARLPEPELRAVDLARVVRDTVTAFSQGYGDGMFSLELNLAEGEGVVNLDEALFGQALINVLANAIEATEGMEVRRVAVSVSKTHHEVMVSVADNGAGVADDIRQNLFNGFSTTKAKGTGTGLNLARQIALAHGGTLRLIANGPDQDTMFAFTLPLRGGN